MGTPDDLDTAMARLGEIGLGGADLAATISATGETAAPGREQPRISIDLHSTVPSSPRGERASSARVERDLEVVGLLGEGGMGKVMLARQHSLDREVAIKTLHAAASERERAALIAEGAITGYLEHPSIVPVHALGLDSEGRPVLVMKRVEGVEWSRLIDDPAHPMWGDRGGDRLARHLEILIQVCRAVELAHSRGVVHRDIKPHNVLIGRYGDVYLCDWGLAVRTERPWQEQPLCGTPGFMAPEMLLGRPVDPRTDVYLLGATLHYVLTGTSRNRGDDARTASLAALDPAPVRYPASVPEDLAALANRATARDPDQRLGSARELREALASHRDHASSLALARSASTRIDELDGLGAAAGLDEAGQARAERLGVEARFALEQALAQWSDNPLARQAATRLDELLAARRARAAELERLARDLDPEPLGPERAIAFAVLGLIGVALAAAGLVSYPAQPSPARMFQQSFVPLGAFALLTALLRRRVLQTVVNRRLVLLGVALIGGITLSRGLGVAAGTTTPVMMLHDGLLAGVILGVGASYLFRWMMAPALMMLAAAVVAATSPPHAHLAFSLASGGGFLVAATIGGRRRRKLRA